MLVGDSSTARVRALRWALLTCLAGLILVLGSLAPHFTSSAELVRLRNALLIDVEATGGFEWSPAGTPAHFKSEDQPPDPKFSAIVKRLGLESFPSDWDRALAIGRHLTVDMG